MLYVGTCVYFIEDTFEELSTGNTVWYFFWQVKYSGVKVIFRLFFSMYRVEPT